MNDRHEPLVIAPEQTQRSSKEWIAALTDFAVSPDGHGVELVGVTRPQAEWFFEGRSSDMPWVVLLAIAMDHEQLATAPEHTSAIEVHKQYNRGTSAARALADWFRSHGFRAEGHGSIINRELGSSFRLAAVLTDAPLTVSAPDSFGVDDFCIGCRICTDACPPDAISPDKRLVRGVTKWAVDFDRCLPYFAESYGCGICIAVCPWSTPGAAPRLAENMLRKQERRQARESESD